MISGFVGCDNCYRDKEHGLLKTVLDTKENNYDDYCNGEFYRKGYKGYKTDKNNKRCQIVYSCDDCSYYKGCDDCALANTEYCIKFDEKEQK